MAFGKLVVQVSVAQEALPLSEVLVSMDSLVKTTDDNGFVQFDDIEAPDVSYSLNPDNTQIPYSTVDVMIEKEILAYCFKQHKKMERHLWAQA